MCERERDRERETEGRERECVYVSGKNGCAHASGGEVFIGLGRRSKNVAWGSVCLGN